MYMRLPTAVLAHTDGKDYILGNQTILLQPNETTRNVTIELIHDGVVKMTEAFGVQLIPAEGVLVTERHAIVRIVDGQLPVRRNSDM